jgi:ATP/maltotriose-dependent transcriptional regulator MalT/DNA-binding SARP family transcriptional activator
VVARGPAPEGTSPGATLASKLVPPAAPRSLVPRPRLEERLRDGLERRLTTVVAGAGFGKSTLLASWVGEVNSAWYCVTAEDASLATLARGVVDALRLRVPGIPAELAAVLSGSRGPDAELDEAGRAQAFVAALAQSLQEQLSRDLVLVLDDVHELGDARGAATLVEALCRQAPPTLHLLLASRSEPPFPIGRLRGQGQVVELGGSDLSFTPDETAELVAHIAGASTAAHAAALWSATGGWPAALRLAVEALRELPPERWEEALAGVRRPGGSLYAYLAEEVFGREPEEVRELVRRLAPLERFTTELCDELGILRAAETLGSLARRGLFVERHGHGVGWFSLNALVRDFASASFPLAPDELRALQVRAASWLERHGHVAEALRLLDAAEDTASIRRLLVERGPALLDGGAVDAVAHATELVPEGERDVDLELLAGRAKQVLGDWEGALRSYERAGRDSGRLPAALAWRMGLIHHFRGRLDEALAVYQDAVVEGAEPRDEALLLAWRASALWLRGDAEACRVDAERAHAVAAEADDPQGLAAAHTVLAMLAALEGDRGANDAHYLRALDYAQDAGDVLQVIRVRTNSGSRHLEEGAYEEAIAELDIALQLADVAGFTSFRALALTNRGEARSHLGRLEEAIADLTESRRLYERLGSRMVSYPLEKLGEVYRERGDLALARAAYEEALAQSEQSGDVQGLVPALAGLARVIAVDEPETAAELAARAVSAGPGMDHVEALLARGWVALARGDREAAARDGTEAAAAARSRRDPAGLAESLELLALAAPDPRSEVERLEEAAALWRDVRNPLGTNRVALALALLRSDDAAAAAADERLRELGARGYRAQLARLLTAEEAARVAVQTLGRFRVMVDGAALPLAAWQSRKARDLLKILVARRGRPVPREALMEALWPGEDPGRLANRLSVALSTLRAVLDPQKQLDPERFVGADRGAVWLDRDHVAVDVERFLADATAGLICRRAAVPDGGRLARAESAYAGDFLEEDAYEDWAIPLREEARAVYIDIARALAEDAAAAGDVDGAVRHFLRVLEKDPYDERAHLALVAALAGSGRHGEARRSFRAYCARMEEIGVESAAFPVAAAD